MSEEADKPPGPPEPARPAAPASLPEPAVAWQPFTFRGVAAFASAPVLRVFLLQVLAALLASASVVWFLAHCYSPVVTQAVEKLPAAAGVTNGQLTGFVNGQITETKFLSIAIPGDDNTDSDESADTQITLHRDHVQISSILSSALGSFDFDYDTNATIDFSRAHLEPLWGAWQPAVLTGIGAGLFLALLVLWAVLAVIYAPAAKFVAWFCDRQISWTGAWRLAAAALLPGAVLLTVGVLLYGWQRVDLFGLAYFQAAHFLVGWTYLLASPCFAPRQTALSTPRNPFQA